MSNKKPVKIPPELIKRLEAFGPRFVKVARAIPGVKKSGKGPIEHSWQLNPLAADDKGLQEWLANGGNYGVLCGKVLYGIDIDDPDIVKDFEMRVKTFTVESAHGKHFYITSDIKENGTILGLNKKNIGNIQCRNKQMVGPGSYHYSGKQYKICNDVPIAFVSQEELEDIFPGMIKWSGQSKKLAAEQAAEENNYLGSMIPLREIVSNFGELKQISEEEYQGYHPIHGSETGQNFCVNVVKNCWHCFRCNSGGGPLLWLAVKNKLIRCDQAQKGVLKGELLDKVRKIAEKADYIIEEKINSDVKRYFRKGKFIPALLAKDLMMKFYYVTRETDELIFVYRPKTGTYSPRGEAHIKRLVKAALGDHMRKNRTNEVIFDIKCSTLQRIKETPPKIIALKNCLYNLKTKETIKFSPKYFILTGSNANYNPEADRAIIEKFLSEIVDKDDIDTLQEIAGYCLWRKYPYHRAFMFVGEGANGKSTFLELVRTMLGEDNTTTIALQDFASQRFAVGDLYGMAANIYPDLPDKALRTTGMLKMLTGGDTVSAEYKFKDRFTFKNYAKMLFACNKVPETSDDTTAFFRRWIVVNFPNQFLDNNPNTDKNILEKLTTNENLSAFLHWALDGLERLLKQKGFSKAKSVDDVREQWTRASAPVKAFIMDCTEHAPGEKVAKDDMYQFFIEYCKAMKLPTVGKGVFGRKIQEGAPWVRSGRLGQNRAWVEIRLKQSQGDQSVHDVSNFTLISKDQESVEHKNPALNKKGSTSRTRSTPKEQWYDAGRDER